MQEEFECNYDDFDIIRLDPNVEYVDSSDSEMEYEDVTNENKLVEPNIFENELNYTEIQHDDMEMETSLKCATHDGIESMIVKEIVVENSKPRKKLNLEEYKIRRANKPAPEMHSTKNLLELCVNIPETLPPIDFPTDPRSIRNLLLNPSNALEEVSEEPNKTVVDEVTQTIHPDYEELVLVSMECNTDISISPKEVDEEKSSTNLLTNIVNSFQQQNNNNSARTILNSSTSLLSSINAVLNEKRNSSPDEEAKTTCQVVNHGENKVIMHLRKDRLRPFRSNCEVQTETTPLFPPLILSPSLIFNRIKNARNFRRRSSRSRSRSRSISPEPEYYHRRSNYKYSRSVNSSSMNSSDSSESESDTSEYSSCRSTDSKFDNRFKHGYQRPNFTYQEERKIIYIGGLLEETTKDELRRKFLKYGTIKKISLHVKEDGSLRYGFVTFAESNAAYDVLDGFNKDPGLSNFDLRFGGRRKFCRQTYADLDSCNNQENEEIYTNGNATINNNKTSTIANTGKSKTTELSFEDLLNMTKRKLCKN